MGSDQQTLTKIQEAFAEHRAANGKRAHYTVVLKHLATSAVSSGIMTKDVADAAGVSPKSICVWQKMSEAVPQPKQLRVTNEPIERNTKDYDAKIELAGGVVIAIPVEALTGELLQRLRGGEA